MEDGKYLKLTIYDSGYGQKMTLIVGLDGKIWSTYPESRYWVKGSIVRFEYP